jgi:hypothetical protein
MSAEIQASTVTDTSKRDGVTAILFLLALIVVLTLATYFFGVGFLLGISIVASFIMLGVLMFLSSPRQKV